VFVHDAASWVAGETLWREYGDWTEAEALPLRERMTRRQFFAALESRGLERRKRNTGVVFHGVKRAEPVAEAPRLAHVP
jgi:putative DNA primase/helicase